jgi:hypothetical protein
MGKKFKYPEERSRNNMKNIKDSSNSKTENSLSHII